MPDVARAYEIRTGEPDEARIYELAQQRRSRPVTAGQSGGKAAPLRILWIGAGNLRGVFRDLFLPGNEVLAVDLVVPAPGDLRAARAYARDHGYRLDFERGDGTRLRFRDGSFDVVLSTQFLCQDFDPRVVVREIRRVLAPGGRFGYYEDQPNIDKIIVGDVFGPDSVIEFEYDPSESNIIAGVVQNANREEARVE